MKVVYYGALIVGGVGNNVDELVITLFQISGKQPLENGIL